MTFNIKSVVVIVVFILCILAAIVISCYCINNKHIDGGIGGEQLTKYGKDYYVSNVYTQIFSEMIPRIDREFIKVYDNLFEALGHESCKLYYLRTEYNKARSEPEKYHAKTDKYGKLFSISKKTSKDRFFRRYQGITKAEQNMLSKFDPDNVIIDTQFIILDDINKLYEFYSKLYDYIVEFEKFMLDDNRVAEHPFRYNSTLLLRIQQIIGAQRNPDFQIRSDLYNIFFQNIITDNENTPNCEEKNHSLKTYYRITSDYALSFTELINNNIIKIITTFQHRLVDDIEHFHKHVSENYIIIAKHIESLTIDDIKYIEKIDAMYNIFQDAIWSLGHFITKRTDIFKNIYPVFEISYAEYFRDINNEAEQKINDARSIYTDLAVTYESQKILEKGGDVLDRTTYSQQKKHVRKRAKYIERVLIPSITSD